MQIIERMVESSQAVMDPPANGGPNDGRESPWPSFALRETDVFQSYTA